MKKHAHEEFQSDPAKRKKFYQDEINKLKLEKNLTLKEKSDAAKNLQMVSKGIEQLRERLEETKARNESIKEQIAEA